MSEHRHHLEESALPRPARSGGRHARPTRRPAGAHVSIAGSLMRAARETEALGGDALQIFPSSPRGWSLPHSDPEGEERLAEACAQRGWPLFVHAPYLVNVASPDPEVYGRSVASLIASVERAARLGARGVVVHAGSTLGGDLHEARSRASAAILAAVASGEHTARAARAPDVLVELTAGGGSRSLARHVDEAAAIIEACGDAEGVGVCLDTCHLWAAGIDIASPAGLRRLRAEVRALGAGRVRLIHVNDSKDPLGSSRDRHANLGEGTIGVDAIRRFLAVPDWRHVPAILETPGPDDRRVADLAAIRA